DPIGPAALRILPDPEIARRIDLAVDASLASEPVDSVGIEGAGIEVGVSAVLGQLPHVDGLGLRIVADDRVLPAVGDPGLAVGTEHPPVRRRALAQRHLAVSPAVDVDDAERALA